MAEAAAQTVATQSIITFEDINVYFTPEEWKLLNEAQKRLYYRVMLENFLMAFSVVLPICRCHLITQPEPVRELRVPDKVFIAPAETDMMQGSSGPGCGHTMEDENASSEQGVSIRVSHGRSLRVDPSMQKSHQCSTCDSILEDTLHLAGQQGISGGQQPYPCQSCGRAFWVSGNLDQIPGQQSGETFLTMEMGQAPSLNSCTCHRSENAFTSRVYGDDFLASSGLVQHHATHNEEPYRSAECEDAFHAEQIDDKCSECGEAFSHKDTCSQHQNTKMGKEPYKCNKCGRLFDSISLLNLHQGFHTKPRPYNCAECGKRFVKNCTLLLHHRFHSGAKPYECSECRKAFSRSDVLRKHQKIHSGERPHLCSICGKTFIHKDALAVHQKTHLEGKPYRCDQCGKCFRLISYLKTHKKIHSATRPRVCPESKKSNITNPLLNQHKKVHTAARPMGEVNEGEPTEDAPTLPGPVKSSH